MVSIKSNRFGNLSVNETELISFPEGILGFENETSFCIVDPDDSSLILWLQSTKSPNVCFPIIEPNFFTEACNFPLPKSDLNCLELDESSSEKAIYNILTIPSDPTCISANMKAPIVVNIKSLRGKQIVLQDNKLSVSEKVYDGLKRSISSFRNNPESPSSPKRFKTVQI